MTCFVANRRGQLAVDSLSLGHIGEFQAPQALDPEGGDAADGSSDGRRHS